MQEQIERIAGARVLSLEQVEGRFTREAALDVHRHLRENPARRTT